MNDLVPDVVDVAPPSGILKINYAAGLAAKEGNELTPTQVKDQPGADWSGQDGELYTLIMTDPDAPSRAEPAFREILHWAVINIPGNKLSSGQVMAEYIGSGPPEGSGLHRYVFLLYHQSQKIEETLYISNHSREGRISFNSRQFADKYGLGKPIAACFYQAQYDDYVPLLHKQLAGKAAL